MEKMKMESPNLITKNIEKIAVLFPNCITETADKTGRLKKAVDFEMLRSMLSEEVADGEESYEFTWVGKKSAIAEVNKPIRKTLRPCKEESICWDTTENLYIEGDNLEVMKLLQESYFHKVKMIYIDPPYNTGSDFIYRDNFEMNSEKYAEQSGQLDENGNRMFRNTDFNGRFHSDWCSMMYSRLMLARNLLSDDGIILINMDENEITNLQRICADVFGETNDLGTIVWDKRNPKGDAKGISYQHEYILVYASNRALFTEKHKVQRPKKNASAILKKASQLYAKLSSKYTLEDVNADFSAWLRNQKDFSGGEKAYQKIDENGNVYRPVSMAWPNKKKAPDDYFIPLIHPVTHKPCPVPERGWRNPPATMQKMLREGRILFGKDESTIPNSKYLLQDNMYENIPSLLYYAGSDTELLSELGIPFDTPKVVSICKEHIASFTGEGDIILDFFSGSATTAHAVMQLNAEDGGHRRFIMIQLPEVCSPESESYQAGYRTICEIGKERIRRAGEKIRKGTGADIDYGFRVFRLDDSNMEDVYYHPEDITQQMLFRFESNIKPDRNGLDLLFGCLLEWGLPLSMPYCSEQVDGVTVHTYNDGDLIACFDKNIPESAVKAIAERQPRRAVFRDDSFADSPAKINVSEIFRMISPDTRIKVI
ncbi:MAG: site-specific DNA-methyltransferase [Oscillospiraceae bacterium]|nr:site-specific DNA-methyltransferase [Oscillospiraceae bacterium]